MVLAGFSRPETSPGMRVRHAWRGDRIEAEILLAGNADFFEINRGLPIVILQSDESRIGTGASNRLEPLLARGNGLRPGKVVYPLAIQENRGLLSLQDDIHGVPFP